MATIVLWRGGDGNVLTLDYEDGYGEAQLCTCTKKSLNAAFQMREIYGTQIIPQ